MTHKKASRKKAGPKHVSRKKTRSRRIVGKKATRKKSRAVTAAYTVPATSGPPKVRRREPGYSQTPAGVYAPDDLVSPGRLREGMKSAAKKLEGIVSELVSAHGNGYAITEVEVSASFDVNGKFLGFGVGGAASVKLRLRPLE